MNEYLVYKYIEFFMFSLYLLFIFLLAQIWFLWKDIEKNDLIFRSIVNESFFKRNCLYIFLFSTFFMGHEILEGMNIPDTMVFFELLDLFAVITLVVFAYDWYVILKSCVPRKNSMKDFAFD